ncbi:VPLPA-CTERM sorting domain-containing protein [Thalassococcus sp. BH17M4-6]|uniref:VPLPA-CTERM sorting domain-containing protein n=1 Tax=Thalassococcus sp. BH17M4-6 TaxID=3413148 RepID=UPI003BD90824
MTKIQKISALVCASFLTAPVAMAAPILIDSFDAFQEVIDVPTGTDVNFSTVTDASILGGSRFMSVTTDPTGNEGSTLRSTGTSGFNPEGALTFANDPGQRGVATVSYGVAAGGIALGDLTDGNTNDKLFFEVLSADLNGTTLETTVTDGDSSASITETFDATFNPFTSFSLFAGIDFGNVQSISFVFDTQDVRSFDGSVGSISAVPLPASALLLLGGLGGLAAFGKRRRRKA